MYRAKATPKTAAYSRAQPDRSSPAPTFPTADHERPIPSMVDGLTPAQRKVLFCAFKRDLVKDVNVARFAGYVIEHSAYRHGDRSLASTIMAMAQDFVGSNNNINLLEPRGQFGSRNMGGKDAADTCHIYTRLPPITRLIFPKDDDAALNYLNEDGLSIEPSWYMPVIPMVLVNGGEGNSAGLTSYVPSYNPRDIIANLKRLLNQDYVVPMEPWYKGFKGSLKETSSNAVGVTYTISGVIEEVGDTKLKITELPVHRWTVDYKDFLESLCPTPWKCNGKVNTKEPPTFVEEIRSRCHNESVEFEVILSEKNMNIAKQEGLEKKFKLTTLIRTTNMYLFDSHGKVRKYDTPEDILKEFFELRLEYYYRRKKVILENIGEELLKVNNKVRFILSVISGDIMVANRKMAELILELKKKHYSPIPKKNITAEPVALGAMEENDGSHVEDAAGVDTSDYEYLLDMAISTLTREKVQELIAQEHKLHDELKRLGESDAKLLWLRDLNALEKELDVLDAKFAAEQEQRRRWQECKVAKEVPKRQPNTKNAAKSQKASAPVRNDEGEALEPKDSLAAYDQDSYREHNAMETQTADGQQKGMNEPSRKRPAASCERDEQEQKMPRLLPPGSSAEPVRRTEKES